MRPFKKLGETISLSVEQTISGLDIRDFDTSEKLMTNGRVLAMAVVSTINNDCHLNLIESDVTMISIKRYLRRLLVDTLNFKYTINTTIGTTSITSLISSISNAVSTGSFIQNIINSSNMLGYTGYSNFVGLSVSQPTLTVLYISTLVPTLSPSQSPNQSSHVADKRMIISIVIASASLMLLISLLLVFYYKRRKVLIMYGLPSNDYQLSDIVIQLQQILPGVVSVKHIDQNRILVYFDSNIHAKTSMTISTIDGIQLCHHQVTFRWSYHLSSLFLLLLSSSSSVSIPDKPTKPTKPTKYTLNIQSLSSFQVVPLTDDEQSYNDNENHYCDNAENNIQSTNEKMLRLLEENKRLKEEIQKIREV